MIKRTGATVVTLRKRPVESRGKEYQSAYVTIPSEMVKDTSFPFKIGDQLVIRIEGKRLVLEEFQARIVKP